MKYHDPRHRAYSVDCGGRERRATPLGAPVPRPLRDSASLRRSLLSLEAVPYTAAVLLRGIALGICPRAGTGLYVTGPTVVNSRWASSRRALPAAAGVAYDTSPLKGCCTAPDGR